MTTAVGHSKAVHEFLLSTQAYPDRPSHVELKETHISWVYLTDRFVYKQKKPVQFQFLDFSTLELRKQFCEQEVALNQRFSPEIYLGVVPVSLVAGHYQLKSGANAVEWLVKMKKLDENNTLENLIRTQQLTPRQIKRLAERLTDFYTGQAPAMLRSNDFVQNLRNHIQANRNDLLIALPQHESLIQFVTNAQLRCLSLETDAFVQRVADGRVVDGHGDLRPEHIYYRRGQPAIIDCIEFNEEYRTNDVIDELAFLAMECDRLGNHDIGQSIEQAYLKSSSDDSQPFLANFYKCYRACVRAKVAALRANQSANNAQAQARQLAQEYLQLARNYAEKMGPKLVIMVGGLSGTGKSTLASALRDVLSAELLQTDVIRQELFQPDSPNGKYTAEGRQRVYDGMVSRIESSLQHSPTVILDGTFSRQATRRKVQKIAKDQNARVLQIQCECPRRLAASRVAQRSVKGADASEATPNMLDWQAGDYEPPTQDSECIHVDTTTPPSEYLDAVTARLRS